MWFNFVLLLGVWIALTQSGKWHLLLVGVGIALGITVAQRYLFPSVHLFPLFLLRRPQRILFFLVTLAIRFITSTIRTCWLILFRKEEGRIVALPIRVRDPLPQFLLLNSITLCPATISLLVEDELLYIHWLGTRGGQEDWRTIKESLEERLISAFARRSDGGH